MGFLDSLVDVNRNNRNQFTRDMLQAFSNAKVENFTERGIQFSAPDTRASSALARQAVRGSTGMEPPPSMSLHANDPAFFREIGDDTFKKLQAAGVKPGTSLLDVMKALQPPKQHGSGTPQQRLQRNDTQPQTQGLIPMSSNGYAMNNGQSVPTDAYQAGYQSQTPDSLNDLQLDTFIAQQHSNFQRLLHSALFSDY